MGKADDSASGYGVTSYLVAIALLITLQSFLYGYMLSWSNNLFSSDDGCDKTSEYEDADTEIACGSLANSVFEDGTCTCTTDGQYKTGSLLNDFDASTVEQQTMQTMGIIGAAIASFVANYPSDTVGRKSTLFWNNFLFIFGAILTIGKFSDDQTTESIFATVCIGRLFVGFGVGIGGCVVPVLLSEIAPSKARGAITTLHQLTLVFGLLFANVFSYFMLEVQQGWSYVGAFVAVPCIVMLVFNKHVPESPRWLLRNDREKAAREMVKSLRTADTTQGQIDAEIREMQREIDEEDSSSGAAVSWGDVFSQFKPVMIGWALATYQALTGINAIMFYSTTIFEIAGVEEPVIGSMGVQVLNFFCTLVAIYLIDRQGRVSLLLTGTWMMLIALIALPVVLLTMDNEAVVGPLAVVFTLMFVAGFSIGLGGVLWVYMSEIVSTSIRSKAYGLFLATNWSVNIVYGFTTLTIVETIGESYEGSDDDDENNKAGAAWLFIIFGIVTATCLVFMHTFLPETKGKTTEQIQEELGGSTPSYTGSEGGRPLLA
jgi:sugar porter (SP) family MFS transporter